MLTSGTYLTIIKRCNSFWEKYVKKDLHPINDSGRAMVQAVSSRPLNAEALFRSQPGPMVALRQGFFVFSEYFIFPRQYHYTNASYSYAFTYDQR